MTWGDVVRQGLLEGSMLGLLVGGLAAILLLGMWVLGPALLVGAGLLYLVRSRTEREVSF